MKKVNHRLYFYELLFACFLVFTHASFAYGDAYFDMLGRGTVIFFFLFSAFFYARSVNKEGYSYKDTLRRVLRLLIIALITMAIYYAIFLPLAWVKHGTPALFSEFNYKNFVTFWRRYRPKIAFLWFMLALILCYLVYPLINKVKWIHTWRPFVLIPLAVLVGAYVFRIYASKNDFGIWSDVGWTRNFFFTGLPCFLIGAYIYDHFTHIKKIHPAVFYVVFFASFGTGALEVFLHKEVFKTSVNEFYLSSIIQAVFVVIYCFQNPEFRFGEKLYHLFGPLCPTFMYLTHRGIIQLLNSYMPRDAWVDLLEVGIGIGAALVVSFVYCLIKRKIASSKDKEAVS